MAIFNDYINPTSINTDADSINNSIRNILLTQKGTMPGKPKFGSDLHKILFNQIDHITTDLLTVYIKSSIIEFEPRVKVNNIEIKTIDEYNRIVADITYTYNINGNTISNTTSINLKD